MDNTLIVALIAALGGSMPGIIGYLLLRGKVATNAAQVTIDMQATEAARDKIINNFAGEALQLKDRLIDEKDHTRELTARINELEKHEVIREAADKKRDSEQVLRDKEHDAKLKGLDEKLQKSYALLERAYAEIVNLNKQIKVLVEQKSALTGQPEETPPVGDKGIQAAAKAASGEPPTLPQSEGVTLPVKGTVTLTQTGTETPPE